MSTSKFQKALAQLEAVGANVTVYAHVTVDQHATLATLSGSKVEQVWRESSTGPRIDLSFDINPETGKVITVLASRLPTREDWEARIAATTPAASNVIPMVPAGVIPRGF